MKKRDSQAQGPNSFFGPGARTGTHSAIFLFVMRHGQLNAPMAYEHALICRGLRRVVADVVQFGRFLVSRLTNIAPFLRWLSLAPYEHTATTTTDSWLSGRAPPLASAYTIMIRMERRAIRKTARGHCLPESADGLADWREKAAPALRNETNEGIRRGIGRG